MNSPAVSLEWQVDASPFRNPAIWRQMALVFGVPILLLGLLIAIVTEHDRWFTALQVIGIVAAAVLGLLLVTMVLFKLLGYRQHIRLDETGVRSQVSGRDPNLYESGVSQIALERADHCDGIGDGGAHELCDPLGAGAEGRG